MAAAVKPLPSAADDAAALQAVGRLRGAASGTAEGDRLDVLATMIDRYENHHRPMDAPDPIAAIAFRMEPQGLTRQDLEDVTGTRTRIAEVLNRPTRDEEVRTSEGR